MSKKEIKKVVCAVFLYTIAYTIAYKQTNLGSDISIHMKAAAELGESQIGSYPLWHILVKAVWALGQITGDMPINYAAAVVTGIITAVVYLCVEKIVNNEIFAGEFVALAICFVSPIYIPWFNEHIYLGQGTPNTWHNPTNLMVKPFAILIFFEFVLILRNIRDDVEIEKQRYLKLAVLILLSVLAKPSFLQGFLPALCIYILINIKTYIKHIKECIAIGLCFLPAICLMMYQFFYNFYNGEKGEGIGIGWMEVMNRFTPNGWISLLLVVLFPLCYILFNIRKVFKEDYISFASLYLVIGWLEYAVLYEKGARKFDGNFSWATHLAFLIIWIATTKKFFLDITNCKEDTGMFDRIKNNILLVIWLMHVVCGSWYVFELIAVEGMWL